MLHLLNSYITDPVFAMAMLILLALFGHFVADFMFQNDTEAQKKSSSNKYLTIHILKYSGIMFLFLGPILTVINAVAHWLTDYCTSRAAGYMWKKGDRHNFFVVVGFDQFLHAVVLILSIYWYFG